MNKYDIIDEVGDVPPRVWKYFNSRLKMPTGAKIRRADIRLLKIITSKIEDYRLDEGAHTIDLGRGKADDVYFKQSS